MRVLLLLTASSSVLMASVAFGFRGNLVSTHQLSQSTLYSQRATDIANEEPSMLMERKYFLNVFGAAVGFGAFTGNVAAIDVSGLRVEGQSNSNTNNIASQLKAYDGSGSARAREIQSLSPTSSSSPVQVSANDPREPIATWAYRASPGFNPSLTRIGLTGTFYRYNDQVMAAADSKRQALNIQFEFPSDWLQLDRSNGGIQYVDQRNGDKLYVFRAPLPNGADLNSLSKSVIGDLIFDPQGSLVKTGQRVEGYKVSSAEIIQECPMCATRRRFKIKYSTVTGNGLSVERRALVDTYQVERDLYMLMTSSNAVKFEKQDSLERETVERIVSSFQVEA